MNAKSVLVEYGRYLNGNSSCGNSGIMFNGSLVITTLHGFYNVFKNSDLQIINFGSSQADFVNALRNVCIYIHVKDEVINRNSTHTAHFKKCLQSNNIKESTNMIFHNWSFESSKNHGHDWLSIFILLEIDGTKTILEESIENWFNTMPDFAIFKGQNLKCVSSAFGNRNFMNHFSQGIVSNVLGNDNCLVLSDIPLTPGSEGSPVFMDTSSQVAIGIVISTLNWWKGEWLNFTVIADLRLLLSEFLKRKLPRILNHNILNTNDILSTMRSSIFQIYNGFIWGTAILVNKEKGIFLTNAHVIASPHRHPIMLYQNNKVIHCDVVFSNPVDDNYLDIAVVKAKETLENYSSSIYFSEDKVKNGDRVFAVGFPIFSKEINSGATITGGHISHVHSCMIKTTCSIHPGASGGAILDERGKLVAVIVCNAKTSEPINTTYPRLNMNISAKILEPILRSFIEKGEIEELKKLNTIDTTIWKFPCKL